jgi:hypothetical protein
MPRNHTAEAQVHLLPAFCLLLASPVFAAKSDIVELRNGDHITGEVKSLNRGILEFSTDHMGTINIEWHSVARLKSRQLLEVESTSGERIFGSIGGATESGSLLVAGAEGSPREIDMSDTVRIAPLDEIGGIRDRVDGYVDVGFSDTKANNITQLRFDAGISYRDRKRLWDLSFATTQSDSDSGQSGSATLKGEQRRFFGNRWFWLGLLQLDQNDEQDLDLRTLFGGALGRHLVQNNSHSFGLGAGLALSREALADGEQIDSVEMIFGMSYDAFRFEDPELDLNADLVVFPSLTVSGRVRAQATVSLRYELVEDFFTELTLSESFDNKPQSVGAEKNDYAITTSIGYSF